MFNRTVIIISTITLLLIIMALFYRTNFVMKADNTHEKTIYNDEDQALDNKKNDQPQTFNHQKNERPLSKYNSHEFQAGMNVLFYGVSNFLEVENIFQHLWKLGINSVAINFPLYQSHLYASEVTTHPKYTLNTEEISEIIDLAHHVGLSVMIRPIMDEQAFIPDGAWRGQIQPENLASWFNSYERLLLKYVKVAEEKNVKVFNIGTEFNSLEKYDDQWNQLIENIREIYNGALIYSFNYDVIEDLQENHFVENLDFVGLDIYFPLEVGDVASVKEIEKEWNHIIQPFQDQLSDLRPIVTEAGIVPAAGASRTPYKWNYPDQKIARQEQVNYYEATYQIWKPMIDGIYWWNVTMGEVNTGFSPLYSSTEEVIKNHFLLQGNEE